MNCRVVWVEKKIGIVDKLSQAAHRISEQRSKQPPPKTGHCTDKASTRISSKAQSDRTRMTPKRRHSHKITTQWWQTSKLVQTAWDSELIQKFGTKCNIHCIWCVIKLKTNRGTQTHVFSSSFSLFSLERRRVAIFRFDSNIQ